MESLNTFASFYGLVNEWKEDLDNKYPKLVFVAGTPAAGKTFWMEKFAKSYFGGNMQFYSTLDSDHTLAHWTSEHCREVANNIWAFAHGAKDQKTMRDYMKILKDNSDAICQANHSTPMNFNMIDLDEAYNKSQDMTYKEFEDWFFGKYYANKSTNIFKSDFSVRPMAKVEHKESEAKKIAKTKKDVVIAIVGDELNDYAKRIKMYKDEGNERQVYVVFLNMPINKALENDAKRDRHVGEEMINKKFNNVTDVFNELKTKFKDMGIWKLIEMVPVFYKKKIGEIDKSKKDWKEHPTFKFKEREVYDWKVKQTWTAKEKPTDK